MEVGFLLLGSRGQPSKLLHPLSLWPHFYILTVKSLLESFSFSCYFYEEWSHYVAHTGSQLDPSCLGLLIAYLMSI